MTQIIPISVRLASGEQRFFPKAMRGKEVSDSEGERIWRQIVPEWFARPAAKVHTHTPPRSKRKGRS